MTKRRSTPKRVANNKESYFDAERILDERKVSGKWMYLIKWTGHDRNGKPWSPDWQPKDNCTPMLLKEWEQEKLRRKRQEDQKNKENHKEKENQEDSNQEGNIMQDDDPVDLQDDKADSKMQLDIDRPDNKIVSDDNLKQVLDKYCHQNVNDDHLKRKSQSLGPSTVKRDSNTSRKFNSLSFPTSKVKLIKRSPTITNNSPIKNNISILEPNNDETNSTDVFHSSSIKYSHGKKYQIPSRSERVSLINLNKRGLEDSNNNNNSSAKRQRIEDVHDVNRKINITNSSNSNEKVEESRILPTSNIKNKKITSQTNNSSNKTSSDGNSSNQQSIPVNNVASAQNSNQSQAAIHVNSETIKALNSRKNSTKFRPIAAKIAPPSPHTYVTSVASVSNIVNVYPPASSGKKFNSMTSNRSSANRLAVIRNSAPVENSPKNGVSNNDSQNQVSDKNVSIPTTAPVQHTSYFHRSYVQSTSASNTAPTKNSNNVIQTNQPADNQTTIVTQKSNKQPITPTTPITPITPTTPTSERPNQHQSSNLQNSTAGSSTMEDNNDSISNNRPFYQLPLDKLKEPTTDLWMNEWVKAKSLNDTLEKEKSDWLKEKNKYFKEVNQLRTEVERRPQTESEPAETIKKCQEIIQKMYNEFLISQEKYTDKCKEYTKLESEHSKLQNDYNKIKKIVMTKHSEVETLKENLNEKTQELKELKEVKEESNRLKADWSRITKNGVIFMREDCAKITKLQNTLQELINQRSSINGEINKLRETIGQEVDKMKEDDDDEDYEKLYQRIENLRLQNKLQGTSLKMAEDNSTIAEESAKLMLDLKRLTVEELLGKFDVPSSTVSYPNDSSSSQASSSSSSPISIANLLNKSTDFITTSSSTVNQHRTSEKMSLQSQNRGNQGVGTMRMSNVETRNLSQGNVSTNTHILQARNLTTAPLIVARGNHGSSNLAGNINNFRKSLTDTNSRTLPGSSTNSARVTQSNVVAPSPGVHIPSTVTGITAMTAIPVDMNIRPYTSATEAKSKVIVAKTKTPVKSILRNNYFCEWDLCRRSFDDKVELKKHLKNYHFNPGTKYNGKDKVIDCAEVKIEV